MARIIWQEEYNTGIEIIDAQHKKTGYFIQ